MKIKKDQLLGIIGLVIAAVIAVMTMQLKSTGYAGDPGPRMFPYIGSIVIALSSVVLIIKPSASGSRFMTGTQLRDAAKLFGIYVLNVVLLYVLGFTVSVPIILFIVTWMFSKVSNQDATFKAKLIKSLIYAVVGGAAMYLAYVVGLDANLPDGLLWELLGL